jgi:dynein heavy chain
MSDHIIEYASGFRLYFTTRLRNPHYLPFIGIKVKIVNFVITRTGLTEQLLRIVTKKEKPDLEFVKNQLILQSSHNRKQLKEVEDNILEVISSSQGYLLQDEKAIEVLTTSKILAQEIVEKQEIADKTEFEIDENRNIYNQIALNACTLFFTISELSSIDPMYQYSLSWFISLFENVSFFFINLVIFTNSRSLSFLDASKHEVLG